jgi:hypothetical protein
MPVLDAGAGFFTPVLSAPNALLGHKCRLSPENRGWGHFRYEKLIRHERLIGGELEGRQTQKKPVPMSGTGKGGASQSTTGDKGSGASRTLVLPCRSKLT